MQQRGLYETGPDTRSGQAFHSLVEQGPGKRARTARYRDDHAVETRIFTVTGRPYGVNSVWPILPDNEDVNERTIEGFCASLLAQTLPERCRLGIPGAQRNPREPGPDIAGHLAGERTIVIDEDPHRSFGHASDGSKNVLPDNRKYIVR